jgi:hypothetical protein
MPTTTSKGGRKSQSQYNNKSNNRKDSSDAGYKFKLSEEFQPAKKNIPLLKAIDKKPAGSKLFQGIPGKNKHDIFKMPASLGGGAAK